MKTILRSGLLLGLFASFAQAAVISFTGGNVVRNSGPNQTTNNSVLWDDVNYYEEDGFQLDFISSTAGSSYIGDYYGVSNDVIHGHWAAGGLGDLTSIVVSKIGGGTFDLNYFILTSNTMTGGGAASGTELAYIKANGGAFNGYTQLLPPESWGFPATQIFLGAQFDGITSFEFFVTNAVDCFGMDEFYIDEEAPRVPDAGNTAALLGLALVGLAAFKRRRS